MRAVRPPRDEILAVFFGGFLGAVARAELDTVTEPKAGHWPWATFAVNIVGTFMLGYFAGRSASHRRRAFLQVGVCGALTTFSTFQLELLDMLRANRLGMASGYAAASIVLGLAAVTAARRVAS